MSNQIRSLIDKLNYYTKLYDEGTPAISDKQWDNLYTALLVKEEYEGVIYPDSPTQKINYQVVNNLNKVEHEYQPMLSLDKSKDPKEIERFLFKDPKYCDWCAMFKLDGLTVRLTYEYGKLVKAETRGNGIVGEDITHNAFVIKNIPKIIPVKDDIIVDGEMICTYQDFEGFKDEYKNPRNFAAGSIRLLDAKECSRRKLRFVAWDLVKGCEDIDFFFWRLEKLDDWGFETVPRIGDAETVTDAISFLDVYKEEGIYPIDGYVFKFESVKYGKSLGRTEHHWNNAIAFKFYDDEYETELIDIDWSMSRNGTLTPVAVFEPIDIDGSIVERASLHNLSIMQETLGEYPEQKQKIWVAKMNMIIPQITRAKKNDLPHDHILKNGYIYTCPICGAETKIVASESGTRNFICSNNKCEGRLANRIDHYLGKKGLDVKGISLATIEKLIDWGWLNNLIDIYSLRKHGIEWSGKIGFGKISVFKILDAIDLSRNNVDLINFISALGIPLVGKTIAKEIVKYYPTWTDFREAVGSDWTVFEGFGPEISKAINNFDYTEADAIVNIYLSFEETKEEVINTNSVIAGKTFCITGKTVIYANRSALKADIEKLGGRVVGSMSSKVDFLINNDSTSTTTKNKEAKANNIPIITEQEFVNMKSNADNS